MTLIRILAALATLAWGLASSGLAGSPASSQASSDVTLPATGPSEGYQLIPALGALKFDNPVAVLSPPGETNRLFVVERAGRIMVISNLANPTKSVFLDLAPQLISGNIESGLLGMAFHPDYQTNGWFFVYRMVRTSTEGAVDALHRKLSRFVVSAEDPNVANPDSELRIIAQYDEAVTHNAGDIHFGPDGYLYLSLGDESPPLADRFDNPQSIQGGFFAAIIRIDVDKRPGSLPPNEHPAATSNYTIPPDNPFVGLASYQGEDVDPARIRTELYAIGFRNPWRMSFDSVTGALYCGDVGEGAREEVNVVVAGGNYGWPFVEGTIVRNNLLAAAPPDFTSLPPLVEYSHEAVNDRGSKAVIGGLVYRGGAIPEMYGNYVFGDNVRGYIWALSLDTTSANPPYRRLTGDPGISAFATDPRDGELLVVNYHDGIIKRLVYNSPGDVPAFPPTLGDTGVFADMMSLTPAPHIIPYEINVPFWSDNAIKGRWFSVPAGQKFALHADNHWQLPAGSFWVKHFEMELTNGVPASRRRLETRLLVKNDAGLYGVTYRWDGSTSNATLVPDEGLNESFSVHENGVARPQVWRYPSRSECISCHSAGGGHALGFNTAQMNRDVHRDGGLINQMVAMHEAGYLEGDLSDVQLLPKLVGSHDTSASLQDRVRSYLFANCVGCHHPEGSYTVAARWNADFRIGLGASGIVNNRIITPNSLSESLMLTRLASHSRLRMPPIATSVLDTNAIALLTEWILGFPPSPWKYRDQGVGGGREGSSSISGSRIIVSGSGTGFGGVQDSFHFLYQPMSGNGQIIVRLSSQHSPNTPGQAGIMFRQNVTAGSAHAAILLSSEGVGLLQDRPSIGVSSLTQGSFAAAGAKWLRLVREGSSITGSYSHDGTTWIEAGSCDANLPEDIVVGLAVSANSDAALNVAEFEEFSLLSIRLDPLPEGAAYVAPIGISLSASITETGRGIELVQFFANGEWIGETNSAPYGILWDNPPAGDHSIIVRAVDSSGAAVHSEPWSLVVALPETFAVFSDENRVSAGDWQGSYGTQGHAVAGGTASHAPGVIASIEPYDPVIWEEESADIRAPVRPDGSGRVAAAFHAADALLVDVAFTLGQLGRVTLYFVDWETENERILLVELFDEGTGAVLDSRIVSQFSNGVYLSWTVRGAIRFRISSMVPGGPVLSAIFLDPAVNEPPVVALRDPTNGTAIQAGQPLLLEAEAFDPDGEIARIDYFANGVKVGSANSPPFVAEWDTPLEGFYELTARATDDLGDSSLSEPVFITVELPGAMAVYAGADFETKGNWMGTYGGGGYSIANHAESAPLTVEVVSTPDRTHTWAALSGDSRALQRVDRSGGIAATLVHDTSFPIQVRVLDGGWRRLALYFLDWDTHVRMLQVEVFDGFTGILIDSREIRQFHAGEYHLWMVRGHVIIRITCLQGANAVLSGIFFDEVEAGAPDVSLTAPWEGGVFELPTILEVSATAVSGTEIKKVEFFANDEKIGETLVPPFSMSWEGILEGGYSIRARAANILGFETYSQPVDVTFTVSGSEARFLRVDHESQGDWIGRYGTVGHILAAVGEPNLPHAAHFVLDGHQDYVWHPLTNARQALQRPDGTGRIAATWYDSEGFGFDLRLRDGHAYQGALYFLDWDQRDRALTVDVFDPVTGSLLDSRTVSDFISGKYLIWRFQGNIRLSVALSGGGNAVSSGFFLDPYVAPFDAWRAAHFSPAELPQPEISGMRADPDGDGLDNLMEYALGLDPRAQDVQTRPRVDTQGETPEFVYSRARDVSDVTLVVEISDDLLEWRPISDRYEVVEVFDLGTREIITLGRTAPPDSPGREFIRLKALAHED